MNSKEIWGRYEAALEARPSKGEWTPEQVATLTDAVADVPALVKRLEELTEREPDLQEVRLEAQIKILGQVVDTLPSAVGLHCEAECHETDRNAVRFLARRLEKRLADLRDCGGHDDE